MNKIEQFIKGQSRNKLIITNGKSNLINPLDIGSLFSKNIKEFTEDKRLPLRAKEILEEIFNVSLLDSNIFGKHLALQNIGILFEPELKIDFLALIDKFSRDNILFIQWDGEIENECLYFLCKQNGIKINIKELSHIII